MSTQVNKYRLWCITEGNHVEGWGESPPTVCYNNESHQIDTASITQTGSVGSNDVNITSSETVLDYQEKKFPDFSGYPCYVKGAHGTMAAGARSFIYLSFDQVVRIQGGGFRVSEEAAWGDFVDVELTYGEGGPVVGQFLSTMYILPGPDYQWYKSTSDSMEIPIGICLRLGYTSTGSVPVKTLCWFDLRRTPSE